MFIESFRRNWSLLHSPCFFFLLWLTWLPPKSCSFATLPLKNLDEAQRCSELLHLDGLRHHIRWILLRADLYQIDHLIIHDPLTYLVIPYINVLHPLVIHVIFSEMNRTLTVAMNPNWVLYDTKRFNQSSQPQTFIWCFNCSHVLRLCR